MILGIDASRANEEQKTGVGWYAWHVIQEMKQIIPKSTRVVLYSREPLKGMLAELPENWESKVLKWPPKRLWTQLRLSIEMLVSKPDVLFIPAHVPPPIRPKKTIMMVHDTAAETFPEGYSRFERWYSLWSAKRALKTLWKVLVPSEFVKEELKKIGPTKQVCVVHHGYDEAFGKQIDTDDVLKKYNITKPFLLFIGRLETKKNTARLVEAFSLLEEDVQLVLVGKPGHGYEQVQKAIKKSKKKDNIIFPGWVAQQDVPALMQAADAYVFPSLYEGFGIPVLEANAAGTPVITSNGSSLTEVAGEAALFVDPQNMQDMLEKIKTLVNNEALQQRLIEKGKENVKRFSWMKAAKQTVNCLMK